MIKTVANVPLRLVDDDPDSVLFEVAAGLVNAQRFRIHRVDVSDVQAVNDRDFLGTCRAVDGLIPYLKAECLSPVKLVEGGNFEVLIDQLRDG